MSRLIVSWASVRYLLLWLLLLRLALSKNLGQPGNRPSSHKNTGGELVVPNKQASPACPVNLKKASTNRTLTKREISWETLVRIGTQNRCFMEAHQNQVEQSAFDANDVGDFNEHGWITSPSNAGRVRSALSGLEMRHLTRPWPDGLDMTGADERVFTANSYIHGRTSRATYTPDAVGGRPLPAPRRYNPTFASYTNAIDVQHGVLVAKWGSQWEPEKAIRAGNRHFAGGPLPPLGDWNDVVFLDWTIQRTASTQHLQPNPGAPPPVIKYILIHDIEKEGSDDSASDEIIDTIFEAFERTNSGNPGPPVFRHKRTSTRGDPRDNEAFHALLGTRAGGMVALLLAEHKADLGVREVTDISVFGIGTMQERYDRQRVHAGLIFKIDGVRTLASGSTTPGLSSGSGSGSGSSGGGSSGGFAATPQELQPFGAVNWAQRFNAANNG